jgi:aromatic-L-amino-acid/L-tryptophan decarboxylase
MSGLPLDVPRDEALARAAHHIAEAWRSFDHARPDQPELDAELAAVLQTGLPDEGAGAIRGLDEADRILDESLAPARPRYFAFVGSSGLEVAVLADALASCHDVNLAVHAGAADVVERQALQWLGEFLGFPSRGGAFTSGGMLSNLTALAAARERALPGSRETGLAGRPAALYCSCEAHYSVRRAAELLGLGASAVRAVPIDGNRRMNVERVRQAIRDDRAMGVAPVAIVATGGTTLTGAVDPIAELADLASEAGVWLHVDGAYGLPAAAAPETRELFAGLERADSIAVDAHKWLYLPKACSAVLVRDRYALETAFSHAEAYMLHHDDDELHAVDRTLEYSRPFRALKLWLAFRVHGAAAFRDAISANLALAQRLADRVRSEPELELLVEPQLSVVPFRHVPGGDIDLDAHNVALVDALQRDGRVYVSSATIDGRICLRPCIVNYRTTAEDVDALVDIALEVGRALAVRAA